MANQPSRVMPEGAGQMRLHLYIIVQASYVDMTTYRTSMHIVADLLKATEEFGQEGIKTTSLLTKANISHSRLSKFMANLTGAGLINKIEFDGKNTFVITPRGRQYLESYARFSSIAESFGMDV